MIGSFSAGAPEPEAVQASEAAAWPDAVVAPAARSGSGLAALINPLSFRMRLHQAAARCAARVRAHGGEVFEVTNQAEIEQALEQIARGGIDRLVIAGGDGTLQGAVSWLGRKLDPARLPNLVLLAAGRTNYVATDIGCATDFVETLETVLEAPPQNLNPVQRHSLVCRHPSIPTQHGFFLAAAVVDQVIRHAHRDQSAAGSRIQQYAATSVSVARLLLRAALGRHRFALPELDIEADGLGRARGRFRFVLATSLTLTAHRIDPYADRGRGALRLTAIRADARRWRRRLPQILLGRFSDAMNCAAGYLSGRCERAVLGGVDALTLDGQEFDLDPSLPLELAIGPMLRFLRP